jgi:hypothetical protein
MRRGWWCNSSKIFDADKHSYKKNIAYLKILLFGKWSWQLWRVCKVGVRVIVTTATDDWGFAPVAVCSKR